MEKRIDTTKLRRRYYDNEKESFYEPQISPTLPSVDGEPASYNADYAFEVSYREVCGLIGELYGDGDTRPELNSKTMLNEFCYVYERIGEAHPLRYQILAFCDSFDINPRRLIDVLPSALKSAFVEEMSEYASKSDIEDALFDNDGIEEGLF